VKDVGSIGFPGKPGWLSASEGCPREQKRGAICFAPILNYRWADELRGSLTRNDKSLSSLQDSTPNRARRIKCIGLLKECATLCNIMSKLDRLQCLISTLTPSLKRNIPGTRFMKVPCFSGVGKSGSLDVTQRAELYAAGASFPHWS
jgi:hypothetical protein